MRKIARWGKQHPALTRLIIVLSFILLTVIGVITGQLLKSLGVSLPIMILSISLAIYFITILLYPLKRNRKVSHEQFIFRKSCDALLASSTFLMIVYFGNQPQQLFKNKGSLYATSSNLPLNLDSITKKYKSYHAFAQSLKDESGNWLKWKERKKLLKDQLKAIRQDSELNTAGKVFLTILSVLLAVALLYGVAALACTISCGGSEAAAVVVLIGGAAVIIFLLAIVIKSIYRKREIIQEN